MRHYFLPRSFWCVLDTPRCTAGETVPPWSSLLTLIPHLSFLSFKVMASVLHLVFPRPEYAQGGSTANEACTSLPSSRSFLTQECETPPFSFSAYPLAIPFYLLVYIFMFV